MIVYFVDSQPSDEEFFEAELLPHDVRFVRELEEVDDDAEIVSVHISSKIGCEFLEGHPLLRLVMTRTTGYDHIDVAECDHRGVAVGHLVGIDSDTVAEHTMALILAVARKLDVVREANKQRTFYYEELRSMDLKGKTLGIIGAGRIGLRVAHMARAFGMHLLAYDPYHHCLTAEFLGMRYVDLEDLLEAADVISLHAPLTPETLHLLDRNAFARCRPGVIVVNTARGGLIDTRAMISALDAGILGGAGLDVLEDESVMHREETAIIADQIIERLTSMTTTPEELQLRHPERIKELQRLEENARLISMPNVIFTPHVGFNSSQAVEQANLKTVEIIKQFATGKPVHVIKPVWQSHPAWLAR
jgi:D-lactate dehydrogenase